MENAPAERFRVTDRALTAIRAAGLDPSRTFVVGPAGLRASLDLTSHRRLEWATLDYDLEKETEGFWLDHPDAAFAASC